MRIKMILWSSIWRGASSKDTLYDRLRHVAYAGGWKKLEPFWHVAIRSGQVLRALPLLETVLAGFGRYASGDPLAPKERSPSR